MNTTLERDACATGGSVAEPALDWLAAERKPTRLQRVSTWLESGSWAAVRAWLESPRGRRTVGVTVAAQVALVVVFALVYQPFDLAIYLWGGHAVTHGAELYLQQSHGNWYTYPPFAAALFIPLDALPAVLVRVLWELASIGALAGACALTLKLAGQRPTRIVVLALVAAGLVLEPMYHTLFLGQVNLFLLVLVLADIRRVARGRPAGLGIGIATAIKLTPGIFIVLLLLTRRTRDAVTAAATFACCTAIGFLVDPSASRLYWAHLFYDTRRVSGPYISNQSPYGTLTRLFGGAAHVGAWYYVIPVALGGLGLAIAAVQARRGDWLAAAAVTGITGLLVSPISWTHHWVWALPALVVLARGGRASRIAAACAAVVFVLAPMWWTPHLGGAGDYGDRGIVTVIANCFLLAGLAFLLHMTVLTVRARRSYAVETWIPPIDSRYADVSASASAARMVVAK